MSSVLLFQLFSSGLIIAQTSRVGEEASRITEDGAAASAAIAESMNGLWNDVLGGGLYAAIAQLGLFFGVGTLLLFIVQWAKDMVDGDHPKAFSELIWPLVVVVLLSNQAQPLATATRGLREIINQTNQTLLTSTSASIQLQDAYQRAMANIGSQDAARLRGAHCPLGNRSLLNANPLLIFNNAANVWRMLLLKQNKLLIILLMVVRRGFLILAWVNFSARIYFNWQ